jgi:hypothetical protein
MREIFLLATASGGVYCMLQGNVLGGELLLGVAVVVFLIGD